MHLSHLSLTRFRNYRRLELEFSGPLTLLQGDNAQGKTSLLEAIYFLATSKPVHAQAEREVVNWQASEEPIPHCRLAAHVQIGDGPAARPVDLEILLTPREDGVNFKKQVKINGVSKRSLDLVGLMCTVLFLPEDIRLVTGSPGERRRYLDISLCQIDRTYCHELTLYQKVLAQRNSLLKALAEQGASPQAGSTEAQLHFWDEQLVQHGSHVVAQRYRFVRQLEALAQPRHFALTAGRESFCLQYTPSFNPGSMSERDFALLRDGLLGPAEWDALGAAPEAATVIDHFHRKLHQRRVRELAAGSTLYGPHRDDLRLLANGHDLRTYGSRGQQRTAALTLKLAEVQAMTAATGVAPLLLLDDVMSELDARRRSMLLNALDGVEQAILTTTDWNDFSPEFRQRAQLLHVHAGVVSPANAWLVGQDSQD